jgi:IS1 family transposase
MQGLLDAAPQADRYFSDAYAPYGSLIYYPGRHQLMWDKSQTYSVEADNAELRHYLARLARKSRCVRRFAYLFSAGTNGSFTNSAIRLIPLISSTS